MGEISRLLSIAFSKNSYKTYSTGWNALCEFMGQGSAAPTMPITSAMVRAFIAWLSLKGCAPATIATYVAGVGFYHKFHGYADPTKDFLVSKLLEGCRRDRRVTDTRAPITVPILITILGALPHVCSSRFEELMFKAAMLCAFFGFMRVGEFTADSANHIQDSVLLLSDIEFSSTGCRSVLVSFRTCKTNQAGRPLVIRLVGTDDVSICPVAALRAFIQVRPFVPGPLFCHFGGTPLTRYQFNAVLQKALGFSGLGNLRIRAHSFRIGAATVAHSLGVPLEEIQRMGRWRSDAALTYIRPEAVCTLPGISIR